MSDKYVLNAFRRGDRIYVDLADGVENIDQIYLSLSELNQLEDIDKRSTAASATSATTPVKKGIS